LTPGLVQLFGDETFVQCLAVFWVEATPEGGIMLALGYSAGIEEGLAELVECSVVLEDHLFVCH
jgi:hypothetical protein